MQRSDGGKTNALVITVFYFFTSMITQAVDTQKSNWKGTKAAISLVSNTGDTHNHQLTSSLNLTYKINNHLDLISNNSFQHASSKQKGLTAWQLSLFGQVNYKLHTTNYLYTSINYINDKFDGYDYRWQESIGYGQTFDLSKTMTLSAQLGPGLEHAKTPQKKMDTNLTANASATYTWTLTDKTKVSEALSLVFSKHTVLTQSKTAVSIHIKNNFSLEMSYLLSHTSKPVKDKSHVNTQTSLSFLFHVH